MTETDGIVFKAIVATSGITLVVAGICFYFIYRYAMARQLENDRYISSFRREAVRDPHELFQPRSGTVKGVLVEDGLEVLYLRRLEGGQLRSCVSTVWINPMEEEEEKRVNSRGDKPDHSSEQIQEIPLVHHSSDMVDLSKERKLALVPVLRLQHPRDPQVEKPIPPPLICLQACPFPPLVNIPFSPPPPPISARKYPAVRHSCPQDAHTPNLSSRLSNLGFAPPCARTRSQESSDRGSGSLAAKEKDKEYIMLGLPILGGLSTEFSNVKKAATIDYDNLMSMSPNLSVKVTEIRQLVTRCGNGERGGFVKEMKGFLEECEEQLKVVREEQTRVMELVKRTTEFYQAGDSKEKGASPLQLFGFVKDFLDMVDQVCIDVTKNLQTKKARSVGSSPPLSPTTRTSLLFQNLQIYFRPENPRSSFSSESEDDF